MNEEKRNYLTTEEKVLAVKRHLIDKEPISKICDDLDISTNKFYEWQNLLFEHGAKALRPEREVTQLRKKIKTLEDKLSNKHEVVSELTEELLELKKKDGAL